MEPSKIIDPGEFLLLSDKDADIPASRLPGRQDRARLDRAAAEVDEVLKFVPAGCDRVPGDAFTTSVGRAMRDASPGPLPDGGPSRPGASVPNRGEAGADRGSNLGRLVCHNSPGIFSLKGDHQNARVAACRSATPTKAPRTGWPRKLIGQFRHCLETGSSTTRAPPDLNPTSRHPHKLLAVRCLEWKRE
jgi:hypothetical protein